MDIKPYNFEPRAHTRDTSAAEQISSEEESDTDTDEEANESRRGNTDWCMCGECMVMPTGLESMCCRDNEDITRKSYEQGVACITLHTGFLANCINKDVLQVALLDFVDADGPLDDHDPIHETYRYIAYRRFTRFIWLSLGKRNRKVLPACVVSKIRATFPSETYSGFKYFRV